MIAGDGERNLASIYRVGIGCVGGCGGDGNRKIFLPGINRIGSAILHRRLKGYLTPGTNRIFACAMDGTGGFSPGVVVRFQGDTERAVVGARVLSGMPKLPAISR